MGAEAVISLMEATPETEPCVVSLDGNQTVRVPLVGCVLKTQAVARAMKEKKWEEAVNMRGRSFARNFDTYKMLTQLKPPKLADGEVRDSLCSVTLKIMLKFLVYFISSPDFRQLLIPNCQL